MQKLKVYVCNCFRSLEENEVVSDTISTYLIRWLNKGNIEMSNFAESDIVVFPHGSSVHPALYGQKPYNSTITDYNTERDKFETNAYKKAVRLGKFMIGIERGAILLTALNNGNVIQHVIHHNASHKIKCNKTGKIYLNVPSQHYQMMFPYNLQPQSFELIAFSKKDYSARRHGIEYLVEDGAEKVYKRVPLKFLKEFKEPEIVYYPKNGCFAIQFNCSAIHSDSELITYINSQILEKYSAFQKNKSKNEIHRDALLGFE